jgi:hypothetical protein
MKTVAVISQKGGLRETTLAVHLAVAASAAGLKAMSLTSIRRRPHPSGAKSAVRVNRESYAAMQKESRHYKICETGGVLRDMLMWSLSIPVLTTPMRCWWGLAAST